MGTQGFVTLKECGTEVQSRTPHICSQRNLGASSQRHTNLSWGIKLGHTLCMLEASVSLLRVDTPCVCE